MKPTGNLLSPTWDERGGIHSCCNIVASDRTPPLLKIRPRRLVPLGVITAAEIVDPHLAVGRRRVNEMVVADVNTDVRKVLLSRIEKNQIAGAQLRAVDLRPPSGDVGGAAAQHDSDRLRENVNHHPAAIEPCLRIPAAEMVADVEQTQREKHDLPPLIGRRQIRHLAGKAIVVRSPLLAAASGDEEQHDARSEKAATSRTQQRGLSAFGNEIRQRVLNFYQSSPL